jgi:hypothetical protein
MVNVKPTLTLGCDVLDEDYDVRVYEPKSAKTEVLKIWEPHKFVTPVKIWTPHMGAI